MKEFTLHRRDLEIKLCKCELLAVILIHSPLQARFSPRSGDIVKIGPDSIVGIMMQVLYPRKNSPSPAEIWR